MAEKKYYLYFAGMKRNFIYFLFLLLFSACNSAENSGSNEKNDASNDLDAAHNFIQASLQGKFDVAKNFMLQDEENISRLDAVGRIEKSVSEKQGLWDATIQVKNRNLINDSTSIIAYSNSFHPENTDTIKVVKKDGKWVVDFKYLFNPK